MKTIPLLLITLFFVGCSIKSDREKLIGTWEIIDAYKQNQPAKKENLIGLNVSIQKDSLFLRSTKDTSGYLWTLNNSQLNVKNNKEHVDINVRIIQLENQTLKINVPIFGDTSVWTLKK
jgi:hypothetical protein